MIMEEYTMMVVATNSLQQLIQRGLDAKGWTLADLARATKRVDSKGVAYSTLAAWMNPRARSTPRPENLDVVAVALGLDANAVHQAARAAGGYRVEEFDTDDPDLQVFMASYQDLTAEERERLLRIVRRVIADPDLFPSQNRQTRPDG